MTPPAAAPVLEVIASRTSTCRRWWQLAEPAVWAAQEVTPEVIGRARPLSDASCRPSLPDR